MDTSALGGMYSNRITLVSSDKGVGVNLGNLSARSGDIRLSANGKLSVGDAIAQGNIQAQGGSLALQGKQQAGGELNLSGKAEIALTDADLRAEQSVTLAAESELKSNNTWISAGVDAQGVVKSGQRLTIKSDGVTLNNTQLAADNVAIKADKALRQDEQSVIKADSELDIQGKAIALSGIAGAQSVRLEAEILIGSRSAELQATNSATVRATQQGDWQGGLAAGNTLTLAGGQIAQRGTLAARTLNLNVDSLDNQGNLLGVDALNLTATGDFRNQGMLISGGDSQLSVRALDNRGTLSGNGQTTIDASTIRNDGKMIAKYRC
nr:hypothetical protein [Brenneria salicis]